MKRSNPLRRSESEQRQDNYKHYECCFRDAIKGRNKVNEIFTRKPYSTGKDAYAEK